MKGKTHVLNHDLTFSAHTINCVCHNVMSMFRVLGIYNFECNVNCFKKKAAWQTSNRNCKENVVRVPWEQSHFIQRERLHLYQNAF